MPPSLAYVWNTFLKLVTDSWLSYQEIESYCRLCHVELSPIDVEAIRRLDRIYWRVMNDNGNG